MRAAKDDRPFKVPVGRIAMTDIGTEFQVFDDRAAGQIEVLVTEGKVLVESPSERRSLLAGQRVRPGRNGCFPATLDAEQLSTRDILRTTAWREGRLDLDGETLAGAVARRRTGNAISGMMDVGEAPLRLVAGTRLEARRTGEPGSCLCSPRMVRSWPLPVETPELLVTAEKRCQRIEDMPLAVLVLAGSEAADRGVASFSDLVNEIPRLSINYAVGGVNYGLLTIRGIGGADDCKPNGNPSVALHVDGIYRTSNLHLSTPLFDLERIEVPKRPQGRLNGRNTTAGVINAISRTLSDRFEGEVQAEVGRFDCWSVRAAAGRPVSGRIGVRLAVLAQGGSGFMQGEGAGLLSGFQLAVGGVPQLQVPAITDPARRSGWGDTSILAGRLTVAAEVPDQDPAVASAFRQPQSRRDAAP
ncbi:TonB-dependent receptor plug domain-containing protein [Thermaurantiacus tibetensis]|uniref:TonB-dependent receptor plug domain-containing protein n=1 Tax=Thermaurantiacus tibetensis TaxID=2759035 RepID=UPI00188E0529|nr:TonB-dependent receptor plug domain-containing protein [Thermaurantiacus tibetensis]